MIVRKFMRLLLVPGMAVPLVLVACSSDDSHFLMDTALVDAALSEAGFAGQIKLAANEPKNANEASRLLFDGTNFSFAMGAQGAQDETPAEGRKRFGRVMVPMADAEDINHKLMAGDKEFKGYDIEKELVGGSFDEPATLHAVVFARTEPADATTSSATMESHLAFGLWMVEYKDGNGMDKINVGAFGPYGFIRTNVADVFPGNGQGEMTATFSGPSIGVRTDEESIKTFNAMVSLKAKRSGTAYSLDGTVHDFNGIEMDVIRLQNVREISKNEVVSGYTRLVKEKISDEQTGRGRWEAGFASEDSIVGSYGFSDDDDEFHLIGSFGAYKDE